MQEVGEERTQWLWLLSLLGSSPSLIAVLKVNGV
jgi:hypothetical protein